MADRRVMLKVKIKALAAEARIIKTAAQRSRRWCNELTEHRRRVVRPAARNTLLAYGFLRGRGYSQIEPGATTPPDWKAVQRMVATYGVSATTFETAAEWVVALNDQSARLNAFIASAGGAEAGAVPMVVQTTDSTTAVAC